MYAEAWGTGYTTLTISQISTVGVGASVIVGVKEAGWDRHVWDVPITMFFSM